MNRRNLFALAGGAILAALGIKKAQTAPKTGYTHVTCIDGNRLANATWHRTRDYQYGSMPGTAWLYDASRKPVRWDLCRCRGMFVTMIPVSGVTPDGAVGVVDHIQGYCANCTPPPPVWRPAPPANDQV